MGTARRRVAALVGVALLLGLALATATPPTVPPIAVIWCAMLLWLQVWPVLVYRERAP